jgi:hypothetical protein
MERTDAKRQAIIERGPSSNPYAKIIIPEKRKGRKDRRKINTFIADDRRSGIAERRKLPNKKGHRV